MRQAQAQSTGRRLTCLRASVGPSSQRPFAPSLNHTHSEGSGRLRCGVCPHGPPAQTRRLTTPGSQRWHGAGRGASQLPVTAPTGHGDPRPLAPGQRPLNPSPRWKQGAPCSKAHCQSLSVVQNVPRPPFPHTRPGPGLEAGYSGEGGAREGHRWPGAAGRRQDVLVGMSLVQARPPGAPGRRRASPEGRSGNSALGRGWRTQHALGGKPFLPRRMSPGP